MPEYNGSKLEFDDVSLVDVIKMGIRDSLVQMYISLPATVVSYDKETQTIEAQISIQRVGDSAYIEYPVLTDVPVLLPRNSAGGFSFMLEEGDEVQLVFNQRSSDTWRSKGAGYPPDSGRMFDINDAYALPCINPVEVPYTQREGTEILGEKVFIGNPDEPITLTNAKGLSVSPIESDLVQILSAICDAFSLPLVSAMGPVNFNPQVLKDFETIKAALDKMTLTE